MSAAAIPGEYNSIIEEDGWWKLRKRVDLPPVFVFPYKRMRIQFAFDPHERKFFIRELQYPQLFYDRDAIEEVAERTVDCPMCRDGTKVVPNAEIERYISPGRGGSRDAIQNRGDTTTMSFKDKVLSAINPSNTSTKTLLGSKVMTMLTEMGYRGLFNPGGEAVARAVIGGIELAGAGLLTGKIPPNFTKIMALNALDTLVEIPAAMAQPASMGLGITESVEQIKRAGRALWMGYGPVDAVKELLNPTARGLISNAPQMGKRVGVDYQMTDQVREILNPSTPTTTRSLIVDRE